MSGRPLPPVSQKTIPAYVVRMAIRPLLFAAVCLLAGCLSRPPLKIQTYAFDPPAASVAKRTAQSQRIVGIRSLRVVAPFDDRSLVYRLGDFSFATDPYAEFLAPPAEALGPPVRSWMSQNDLFRTVVEPGSALTPNTLAEITVRELYGDFRRPSEPAAVLTLRFVLLNSPGGIPGELAFEQEYSRRVPLKARNATALMAGWNEALNQILVQLGVELRRLDPSPGS